MLKVSVCPLDQARTYQSLSDNAYCVEQQVPFNLKGNYELKRDWGKAM